MGIKKTTRATKQQRGKRKRSGEAGEECVRQVTETTTVPARGTNFIQPLNSNACCCDVFWRHENASKSNLFPLIMKGAKLLSKV